MAPGKPVSKTRNPTSEQITELVDYIRQHGGNLFSTAARFGIDPEMGDRLLPW